MKAVPSNADRARKTKKVAKFGARAVARLKRKKSTAVINVICGRMNISKLSYSEVCCIKPIKNA
jgi:menaquinone-dependent protoporphyrinogen IX oxidase